MSIQSEINRILHFRDQSFEEVRNKGVTVPQDAIIDDLPDYIAQIQTGSGGTGAISIVDTPDAAGGTVRTITAVDISDTTAVAGDVAQGKYFYTADGTKTAGTASGGGGGGSVSPKQVNFIDYDGTVLYAYTAAEANALSALPANPSHSGLTAQGWNWTLPQIRAQLTAAPDGDVWVGQMYITQSGDTEIDVSMPEGRLSPILSVCVNGTITVNWGDNTPTDTVTGSSLSTHKSPSHTYAVPGNYTIVIHVVSGSFRFYSDDANYTLLRRDTTFNDNYVYINCVHAVRIGSGITSLGQYAFYYCLSLAYVTIPNTITEIGAYALYGCYSLASVTIPSGVTSIGNYSFYTCHVLTSIAIPSTVTSFGTHIFYGCRSLLSVTIPSGVTGIGNYEFYNCYVLASIAMPSTVTRIGTYAFYGCYNLASAIIPSTVTGILDYTFYNCYSLTSATIPSTVTSIGSYAFYGCTNLTNITIPSSLSSIGVDAFWGCAKLVTVTTPGTVNTISDSAFAGCSRITSVTIQSGTKTIGQSAFSGCLSMVSVTIPSTVTSIATYAFSGCYSLASVTIPSGVTSIGSTAFNNCYGVAEYHIEPTTVPTLGTNAFKNIASDCVIYVPSASLDAYKTANNWSTYASYMQGE